MKIGSLVELVDDNWDAEWLEWVLMNNVQLPIKNKIYTVRELFDTHTDDPGVLLEELVNPVIEFQSGFDEPGFLLKRFRELMPPMTIEISVMEGAEYA